ncbi:hypothetical protein DIT68_14555 [Brumimicrobium oceani]|uniref:Uncharacterized protein n=1 Tax=Brumimicrobium oceani TaxID=2100725 RepID=A0A2U2X186_9FLAO|nr:hypothetical protein DIT68_14555 [Brumimicrobium oceani]
MNSGIGDAYFTGLSAGDYNNDGNIDILMSGMNASFMAYTAILQNDGTGHFTEISTSTFEQLYFGSANFIDYDNDGDLDVFITGTTMNSIVHSKLYTNNNGVFTENTAISSIIDNINISSSNWADFDADGDLDLIMNGYDENANVITKIYQNNHTQVCIPNFTNYTQENAITNVRFREINKDSPDSIGTPTYENFISISTPIHRGEPHTITVTGYSNNYPSDVTVYIDLNQNTDLTDSNEEFYLGRIPAGNNLDSISATIYIPSNANLGLLKMRVIKSTNENAIVETNASSIINSPCAQNLLSGQVEDYTLNIKEPPYCPLPSDLTYNINTDHSIEVNWTEPVDLNTFTEYNWKLMNTGDDPLINNAVQTGNANQGMDFIILNGVPGGTYDFYISTNCGTDLSNMAQITLEISYLGLTQEVMETIIYPNPASNQIQIKSQLSLTLVEIFNSTGKLVLQNVFTWDEEQLDISSLQEGQYTIRLSNNNYTVTKKLIITK